MRLFILLLAAVLSSATADAGQVQATVGAAAATLSIPEASVAFPAGSFTTTRTVTLSFQSPVTQSTLQEFHDTTPGFETVAESFELHVNVGPSPPLGNGVGLTRIIHEG